MLICKLSPNSAAICKVLYSPLMEACARTWPCGAGEGERLKFTEHFSAHGPRPQLRCPSGLCVSFLIESVKHLVGWTAKWLIESFRWVLSPSCYIPASFNPSAVQMTWVCWEGPEKSELIGQHTVQLWKLISTHPSMPYDRVLELLHWTPGLPQRYFHA